MSKSSIHRNGKLKAEYRSSDNRLRWIEKRYPQLSEWRSCALEWVNQRMRSQSPKLQALEVFFEDYIIALKLPLIPAEFLKRDTEWPNFFIAACSRSSEGAKHNNQIHDFLEFMLLRDFSVLDANGERVASPDFCNPISKISTSSPKDAKKKKAQKRAQQIIKIDRDKARGPIKKVSIKTASGVTKTKRAPNDARSSDTTLQWVMNNYPQLAEWRDYAMGWLQSTPRGIAPRLQALIKFFEIYLIGRKLNPKPEEFMRRGSRVPDFFSTACPVSIEGVKYNNYIHQFLEHVLLHYYSERDDNDVPVISPAFYNPVPRVSPDQPPGRDESVHSPLPYGYIDELRKIIVEGPNFSDWNWAQSILDPATNTLFDPDNIQDDISDGDENVTFGNFQGSDWYDVTEDQIDRSDPDCVWRVRTNGEGRTFLEMWSPIRWVAILVKLILPLRSFQVRVLDSGEADTWRYENGTFVRNTNRLADGNERRPAETGVFRRVNPFGDGGEVPVQLYINTNKTADIATSASEKGYEVAWLVDAPLHQNVFYWMEKLRDWQEKYNPIKRRTPWTELEPRHIGTKTRVQLASYYDTCFLFRTPERSHEPHFPVVQAILNKAWFYVLEALEIRLAANGITHKNGTEIRFLPPEEDRSGKKSGAHFSTLFPLHSLRVSLITALALEGRVDFRILQKLAGHSRLLMTLYYVKPGTKQIHDALVEAAKRLEATKESSIQDFLLNTEFDELLSQAVCNSVPSLAKAISQNPANRNPAGWMTMHHGVCLVGGNTSELEENSKIGGCHNGGPNVGTESVPKYAPVPGGSRNCVRCRWFVTKPEFVPALVADFNNTAYHFDEARNDCLINEGKLQNLKKMKAEAEDAGLPFGSMDAYRQAERVWERTMKGFSDCAEDLVACYKLIKRCEEVGNTLPNGGAAMVAVGSIADINIALEEIESELLQLSGVCENVEIYPDLSPGKAILRRSQLLDAALSRESLPPVFMLLSEQEQLRYGNAFMRQLSKQMDPTNPALGTRRVVSLIDAGENLSEHLGIDIAALLPVNEQAKFILAGKVEPIDLPKQKEGG